MAAVACSSTTKGNVSTTCPEDGGCEPRPVFATGVLSTILVTPDSVYAGDRAGNVFAADKPLRASRVLSKGNDATRGVASFVRTSLGLYWFTAPVPTEQVPSPKSSLVWFPADASVTEPVVIDSQLARPLGMAAVGDVVYLAEPDRLLVLSPGETTLRPVLAIAAYGLRSHGESLYFHDGLSKISSWRMGDTKPELLVDGASLFAMPSAQLSSTLTYEQDPFVVDDSGLYWVEGSGFGGGKLAHAPLAGGPRETFITIDADVVKTISIDDHFVYWTQADRPLLPGKTTVHRAAEKALASSDVLLGTLVGEATSVQAMPEGLYIAASPSLTDLDVNTLGFTRYGGPLLIIPRAMLDAR
jgi:hypothetical protein